MVLRVSLKSLFGKIVHQILYTLKTIPRNSLIKVTHKIICCLKETSGGRRTNVESQPKIKIEFRHGDGRRHSKMRGKERSGEGLV